MREAGIKRAFMHKIQNARNCSAEHDMTLRYTLHYKTHTLTKPATTTVTAGVVMDSPHALRLNNTLHEDNGIQRRSEWERNTHTYAGSFYISA